MSKIYLLALLLVLLPSIFTQKCQQVGDNQWGTIKTCQITSPAPQLKWKIEITLNQDITWNGSDDVSYLFVDINDNKITDTCFTGQTLKGDYSKGSTILIEQNCLNFKPALTKGDKLYVVIFWSKMGLSDKQLIYVPLFTTNGEMEIVKGGMKNKIQKMFNLRIQ